MNVWSFESNFFFEMVGENIQFLGTVHPQHRTGNCSSQTPNNRATYNAKKLSWLPRTFIKPLNCDISIKCYAHQNHAVGKNSHGLREWHYMTSMVSKFLRNKFKDDWIQKVFDHISPKEPIVKTKTLKCTHKLLQWWQSNHWQRVKLSRTWRQIVVSYINVKLC